MAFLVYGNGKPMTLPLSQQYFYGTYSNQWNLILANFVISSIPIILFYILMQKNIVKGIAAGAAKGCDPAIYITVGTGVGVGVYANGALVHGLVHPEGGHILLQKDSKDTYQGCCPFHRNCVEGLASGPAIVNYIMMYSPQKIILWGGVMHQTGLFPMIREKVKVKMNGYVNHPMILQHMDDYIIPPGLGENPGVLGAVKLGLSALEADKKAV